MPVRDVVGGATVEVWVQPRASKDRIAGVHAGALKVQVAAPPVDGEANEALIRYLAKSLGVPRSRVTILRGETGRRKSIFVAGLSAAEVLQRLTLDA